MVYPNTYRGWDQEGKCINTVTAVDANTQINPAEVKAAIDNIKKVVAEQIKAITDALTNISSDQKNAIRIKGVNLEGVIEKVADQITPLGPQMTQGIDDLYDRALEVHDILQQNNNTEAHNNCWIQDVVNVTYTTNSSGGRHTGQQP